MKIYLDLDGVMADFEKHFKDYFGSEPSDFDDGTMWKMINGYEDFYANLPMMPNANKLFKFLIDTFGDVTILSACPRSNYKNAAMQKRQWVYENITDDVTVIPMMGGKNKGLFMHSPGDILIDDMKKNCEAWKDFGGIAIQYNNYEQTVNELSKILGT